MVFRLCSPSLLASLDLLGAPPPRLPLAPALEEAGGGGGGEGGGGDKEPSPRCIRGAPAACCSKAEWQCGVSYGRSGGIINGTLNTRVLLCTLGLNCVSNISCFCSDQSAQYPQRGQLR